MTIACIDVGYTESETDPTTAIAACVVIDDWRDHNTVAEQVVRISEADKVFGILIGKRCSWETLWIEGQQSEKSSRLHA